MKPLGFIERTYSSPSRGLLEVGFGIGGQVFRILLELFSSSFFISHPILLVFEYVGANVTINDIFQFGVPQSTP